MKNNKIQVSKIPGRSVMYLLICLVIAVIFYFFAIYPCQKSIKDTDLKTAQVSEHLKKQKALLPLYNGLVKENLNKVRVTLPVPDTKGLSRNDIDTIAPLFEQMAEECNMQVVSVSPDALAFTEKSTNIMVNIKLKGKFLDFRTFLVEFGETPCLERVESIEIKQESVYKHFFLTVRLAVA